MNKSKREFFMSIKDMWHLRFGVTSGCNFRCRYCLPKNAILSNEVNFAEAADILHVALNLGISRVHWTGGEPTTHSRFSDLVALARDIGYTQQVITTNGALFARNFDKYIDCGISRVIVSIDTMKRDRNQFLTNADTLDQTFMSIEKSVLNLPSLTKMSVVTMRSTLPELPQFLDFANDLNSRSTQGSVAIKFNQFFPCNPIQLTEHGRKYWESEYITYDEIYRELASNGDMTEIDRSSVEGDNPSYRYFQYKGTGLKVAILALFSWGYPCGGCHKLRITPPGLASSCINQPVLTPLIGAPMSEKRDRIKTLMRLRDSPNFAAAQSLRHHFRGKLGELRFGPEISSTDDVNYFKNLSLSHANQKF